MLHRTVGVIDSGNLLFFALCIGAALALGEAIFGLNDAYPTVRPQTFVASSEAAAKRHWVR